MSQSTTTSVLVFAVILQAVYFDELLKCCAVVQVVEEVEIYVCKCYKGFKHFFKKVPPPTPLPLECQHTKPEEKVFNSLDSLLLTHSSP